MYKRLYVILAMALTPGVAGADSIRVGDEFHRDVYIRTTSDFYYVYHPEEGRMERVSRRRGRVSNVTISNDAALREQLLERYRAAKTTPPAEATAPAQKPAPAYPSTAEVKKLSGEVAKNRQQAEELAAFEAQLAHWRTLSPEVREAIEAGLYDTRAERAAGRALDREQALAQFESLRGTKVAVKDELAEAAYAREAAVQQARAKDDSAFYLDAYEKSKGIVPVSQFFYDECDNLRTHTTWWYTEDPYLYDTALDERSRTEQDIADAEQAYARRASAYGNELASVERAMSQRERAARAAVSKSIDEQRRLGARQTRVAALAAAVDAGYQPRVQATPIAVWSGDHSGRLPDFTVSRGLWQVRCRVTGQGSEKQFAVTVYDAETGKPFTRVGDPDFLGMRMRLFDKAGRYYLVVEQGVIPVPFEIEVNALAL